MVLTDLAGTARWWLRPRWWILAGFAALVGDIGLVAWGVIRDQRWVEDARHHCKQPDFPPLPDNSPIGWTALVSSGLAVLAVLMGAVLYARAADGSASARVTAVLVVLLAFVLSLGLLLPGLILIEPRDLSTGVDSSGIPCPFRQSGLVP